MAAGAGSTEPRVLSALLLDEAAVELLRVKAVAAGRGDGAFGAAGRHRAPATGAPLCVSFNNFRRSSLPKNSDHLRISKTSGESGN